MSAQVSYEEVLNRQMGEQSLLMKILIGAVTHLTANMEVTGLLIESLKVATAEEEKQALTDIQAIKDKSDEFLRKMGSAGVFKEMVLKVQRPLFSNDPDMDESTCLVYDQKKSFVHHLRLDSDAMAMMGEEPKMYVQSRLWIDGTLQLSSRVEDPGW